MSTFLTEETTLVTDAAASTRLSSLDTLESEAIHIIREVVAEFEKPALLFSGGKDSVVMLHLATKAFWPGKVPFPVLHVDTGHNFAEVLEFRDLSDGRSSLEITSTYASAADCDAMVASGIDGGMDEDFERLDEALARLAH